MPRTGTSTYRVLGIDPGLNITGYAVVEFLAGFSGSGPSASTEPTIIEAGAIHTDAKSGLAARIEQIHAEVAGVLAELKPQVAGIEKLYAHYKHPRTAILMAHARGAVMLACRQAKVAIRDLAATEVKKSLTSNGHASKAQVQRAIMAVCRLKELPQPPDVADALAIALCAGRRE